MLYSTFWFTCPSTLVKTRVTPNGSLTCRFIVSGAIRFYLSHAAKWFTFPQNKHDYLSYYSVIVLLRLMWHPAWRERCYRDTHYWRRRILRDSDRARSRTAHVKDGGLYWNSARHRCHQRQQQTDDQFSVTISATVSSAYISIAWISDVNICVNFFFVLPMWQAYVTIVVCGDIGSGRAGWTSAFDRRTGRRRRQHRLAERRRKVKWQSCREDRIPVPIPIPYPQKKPMGIPIESPYPQNHRDWSQCRFL